MGKCFKKKITIGLVLFFVSPACCSRQENCSPLPQFNSLCLAGGETHYQHSPLLMHKEVKVILGFSEQGYQVGRDGNFPDTGRCALFITVRVGWKAHLEYLGRGLLGF